jgi:simple sugar transport system permease protein
VLLALMVVGFWYAQPAFIRSANLFSILQAVSVVAILGVGVSITMAADGFDLSVGSIAASSVMAASYAMVVWQLDAAETMVLVLLMGAFIGFVNGLLIVRVGVPDLLATLATMFLLAGLDHRRHGASRRLDGARRL